MGEIFCYSHYHITTLTPLFWLLLPCDPATPFVRLEEVMQVKIVLTIGVVACDAFSILCWVQHQAVHYIFSPYI